MNNEDQQAPRSGSHGGLVSIEKAILLDVCLGVPLGKIWLRLPASEVGEPLSEGPDTTLFRGQQLELLKRLHRRGDSEIAEAMAELTRMADAGLDKGPFSVTRKTGLPATEDPHDYFSLAKYWWPSENTEDGLPYVKRDGDVNPDCYSDRYDFTELEAFAETVLLLALAAYLTERAEYGKQASRLLAAWFVDEETRQNPTFECAQAIPGKHVGRWQGIVEARRFIYVVEAVHLLGSAGLLPNELSTALRSWFGEFFDWLTESPRGKEAAASKNNIGFWYDLQRIVYADFCGKDDLVTTIATQVVLPRLDEQLAEDGSLPAETVRAYPHDYVAFTLIAMAMISRVGEKHGLSLWDPRDADGRNFRVAHDWLLNATRSHDLVDSLMKLQPRVSTAEGRVPIGENNLEDVAGALTTGGMVDLGLQLRGLRRIAEYRGAALREAQGKLEDGQGQSAQLAQQVVQAQQECDRLRKERSDLGQRLEAREQEIQRLRETSATERDYLQAQLDTANAMWAYYANGGKAPNAMGTGGGDEGDPRQEKKRSTLGTHGDHEVLARDVCDVGRYAVRLEAKYKELVSSRTWRLLGPVRVGMRWVRRLVFRRPSTPSQWPKRPKLLRDADPTRGGSYDAIQNAIEGQSVRGLERHLRELERYALELERKIQALLAAGTWKAAEPLRMAMRGYRRVILRQKVYKTRLPKRPLALEKAR